MSQELTVQGLCAGYDGADIVRGIAFGPLVPGDILSLIGPNAAGKTTLLRAIAGLLPARGSVRLDGRELTGLKLAEHARVITYMPQTLPQRVGLTVLEGVLGALRAAPIDGPMLSDADMLDRAMDVIERVGIARIAMTGLNHLSGGQRQLASLAQALVRAPRVLLLDEPISALDLNYQLRVMKLVRDLARERGMIVIMVLHDLAIAARWSNRVMVLSGGTIAAYGAPEEAITPPLLADVYRVVARVQQDGSGLHVMVDDIL